MRVIVTVIMKRPNINGKCNTGVRLHNVFSSGVASLHVATAFRAHARQQGNGLLAWGIRHDTGIRGRDPVFSYVPRLPRPSACKTPAYGELVRRVG